MAMLMCKNTPIYDIANRTVLDATLCPFIVGDDSYDNSIVQKNYEKWRSNRTYLRTNRIAEQIVIQSGGSNTRESKRRLSLSDSFWVKYAIDKDVKFEDITPYSNSFSLLVPRGGQRPSSTPELVLGGAQPKQWLCDETDNFTYMRKAEFPEQVHAEMLAVKLARYAAIPVMNAFIETGCDNYRIYADDYSAITNAGTINLVNMTTPEFSLIQLDQMGIGVNGLNPVNVINAYENAGVTNIEKQKVICQVVFDGVVGNIDRQHNNSNWGVLMCNETGTRSVSPMYDFNWANIGGKSQIIDSIARNIVQNNTPDEIEATLTISYKLAKCCEDLGLTQWQDNAESLAHDIQQISSS